MPQRLVRDGRIASLWERVRARGRGFWEAKAAVAEFLAMGGYAAYVWPAFAFTFLVMAGLLAQSWRAARHRERELEAVRATLRPGRGGATARPRQPLNARREETPPAEGGGVREGA